MLNMLRTAAISVMIGLGAITSLPTAATAGSFDFSFGDRYDTGRVGIHVGSDHYDYRRRPFMRTCSPGDALEKAWRIGLRHARVVDVDRHTIDVVGRSHGERIRVTFARQGYCRILNI